MKDKKVSIQKPFYAMASVDGKKAEITMYGDIVEEQPVNYWTGEPIEGSFIMKSEFLEDLERIKDCDEIVIRLDSCGGDCGVSLFIHNKLREFAQEGKKLICIVDGVAMSAGTHIMCACDTVKVNPSSIIMIHKCWTFLLGGYNADEMRNAAKMCDAYDKSQISMYQNKTDLSETVISHMMSDTTYMTGSEAVEKGFADELLGEAKPINVAASADRNRILVNGHTIHIAQGMLIPEDIPTVKPEAFASVKTYKTNMQAESAAKEGGAVMAKTVEELRKEHPELMAQLESDMKESLTTEANKNAAEKERKRIEEIDEIASMFDGELVNAAKYGKNACSAQELAHRAAIHVKERGQKFMLDLHDDANSSGAAWVGAVPGEPTTPKTEDEKKAADIAKVQAILQKGEK